MVALAVDEDRQPLLVAEKEKVPTSSDVEPRDLHIPLGTHANDDNVLDDEDVGTERLFYDAAGASRGLRLRVLLILVLAATYYHAVFGWSLPFDIPDEVKPPSHLWPLSRPNHVDSPCAGGRAGNAWDARRRCHLVTSNYARALLHGRDTLAQLAASGNIDASVALSKPRPGLDDIAKLIEAIFLPIPSAESAHEALASYTKVPHVAGTEEDRQNAVRILEQWSNLLDVPVPEDPMALFFDAGTSEANRYMTSSARNFTPGDTSPFGLPRVFGHTYTVWLNSPVSSSLELRHAADDAEPYFKAQLKEDVLEEDPFSKVPLPQYHGYSKSGNATGPIVYANLCRLEDFEELKKRKVSVKGAITLCRYGGPFRGLKVRASADNGAVATLIYSDPAEDGKMTEANGLKPYPEGPARNPSSVQRGSVQALSFYPGDPGTPGKPSYRNATRLNPDEADALPKIPSLPISYRDAKPILESLQSHGAKLGGSWQGGVPGLEGEYWTGPSEAVASLSNEMTDVAETKDIWNVYARIPGIVEDEVVIIGNHHDAWGFGAGDPNSGTAAMHEVVKGLGFLAKHGWRPLRTIVVAAWDAEEFGLVGSTEAVEDFAKYFGKTVFAYLNVDIAASGSGFGIRASPSLADVLRSAAEQIPEPYGNGTFEVGRIGNLGSGSDYTGFLQGFGIASADMGSGSTKKDPVYHYHSVYDNLHWMDKFGDPQTKRMEAVARVLGLATLRLTQSVFAPINVTAYAEELVHYLDGVKKLASHAKLGKGRHAPKLHKLEASIKELTRATQRLDAHEAKLLAKLEKLLERSPQPGVGANVAEEGEMQPKFEEDRVSRLLRMASQSRPRRHRCGGGLRSKMRWMRHKATHLLRLGHGHHKDAAAETAHHDGGEGDDDDRVRRLRRVLRDIASVNAQLRSFESGFIDKEGLRGREWYKHLLTAPGRWKGYGATAMPGLTEALTLDGGKGAQHEADRLTRLVQRLAKRVEAAADDHHGGHGGRHGGHRHGKRPHHGGGGGGHDDRKHKHHHRHGHDSHGGKATQE